MDSLSLTRTPPAASACDIATWDIRFADDLVLCIESVDAMGRLLDVVAVNELAGVAKQHR
jgi:hypothetical protein